MDVIAAVPRRSGPARDLLPEIRGTSAVVWLTTVVRQALELRVSESAYHELLLFAPALRSGAIASNATLVRPPGPDCPGRLGSNTARRVPTRRRNRIRAAGPVVRADLAGASAAPRHVGCGPTGAVHRAGRRRPQPDRNPVLREPLLDHHIERRLPGGRPRRIIRLVALASSAQGRPRRGLSSPPHLLR